MLTSSFPAKAIAILSWDTCTKSHAMQHFHGTAVPIMQKGFLVLTGFDR